MLIAFRVSARQSCLNPIEEASRKDENQTPSISQENIPITSEPVDCSLTSESVDDMHADDLSASISTPQNSSDSTMDIDTADSNTSSSILKDNNGDLGDDCTVPIENETEANKPIFIQSDVDENIKVYKGSSSASSSNGDEANGMDSVNLECKPKKDDKVEPTLSPSVTKPKPLFSPGFLGKRPRKVLVSKKDENTLAKENGGLKPCIKKNDNVESDGESIVVNGGSDDVGKEEGCLV